MLNNKIQQVTCLLLSLTTLNVEASLMAYTSNGVTVVYSSVSNISWTGDANLLEAMFSTQGYDSLVQAIIDVSPTFHTVNQPSYKVSYDDFPLPGVGVASWFGAKAFTSYLNSINYAGSNQWDLPSAGANPQEGLNPSGSQIGELFYNELGGTGGNLIPDTGYFTNELSETIPYWTGTDYPNFQDYVWAFTNDTGYQFFRTKFGTSQIWAITPGIINVPAVPVPTAIWLFGSGLVGLVGRRRHRRMC